MTTVFVAGSRKLGRLNDEIRQRLEGIISKGFAIVVGDANGADKALQKYFEEKHYSNVVVYCAGGICRNNIGKWVVNRVAVDSSKKGRELYTQKDIQMAEDADYGLMLWDGKSAGTINNVLELLKRTKKALVYFSPAKKFYTVSKVSDAEELIGKCDEESAELIRKKVKLSSSLKEINEIAQGSLGF